MVSIQKFINERHKYKVDLTYQRPSGAWSSEDDQCLIDTILRGEPMPLFFLNSKDGIFYIVDGQQRLNAIMKFHDNSLKLNKKFSEEKNHGKKFWQIVSYHSPAYKTHRNWLKKYGDKLVI